MLKKIGIIGGVGWPSTVDYYRLICENSNRHFRNHTLPPILIYSLNFEEIKAHHFEKAWDATIPSLVEAGQALERAGADFVLIASGTTNIPYEKVQAQLNIPILSIVKPSAEAIQKKGLKKVALLGTKATMEHPFFSGELNKFGLEVLVPDLEDREEVHRIIYEELCSNLIYEASKQSYIEVVNRLIRRGAEVLVLGCTEIPLLISQEDFSIPVINMSELHTEAAFQASLAEVGEVDG